MDLAFVVGRLCVVVVALHTDSNMQMHVMVAH